VIGRAISRIFFEDINMGAVEKVKQAAAEMRHNQITLLNTTPFSGLHEWDAMTLIVEAIDEATGPRSMRSDIAELSRDLNNDYRRETELTPAATSDSNTGDDNQSNT
jgi:hypothetical protein